jgi:O-Antigen ligase
MAELALPAAAALFTLFAAYAVVSTGATIGVGFLAIVLLWVLVTLTYLVVPHLAVAGTVGLFALVPALKVFVSPSIGGIKDLVCLSAITAAIVLIVFQKRRMDRRVAVLVALFLALYVIDVGHPHGVAWLQGLRLTAEPMLLLIVGLVLPSPLRMLRFALGALVAVGALVAFYGLIQQALGAPALVSLGYSYTAQVRTISGHLRSFGTLDDPFTYAALLYFSIAAVVFWLRGGLIGWGAGVLMLLGLAASLVRTSLMVLVALIALTLIRRGRLVTAAAFMAATAVIAAGTLLGSSGTQTQGYTVYFRNGGSAIVQAPVAAAGSRALNGRVSAWRAAVGSDPINWVFGRGVGEVGTAALRASQALLPGSSASSSSTPAQAVDSGYFATIADVGLVGLIVLLALLWRLVALGIDGARQGRPAAWIALALLTAMLLDALTRASFTGFPTAFIGMLVTGIALAAAAEPESQDASRSRVRAPLPPRRPVGDR